MQDLIDKLILYGFPEECATEIICDMVDLVGEFGAEEYVRGIERDLYVDTVQFEPCQV